MRIQKTQNNPNFGNLGIKIKNQAKANGAENFANALQKPLNEIGIILKKGFDENSNQILFIPLKENNPNRKIIAAKLDELFPDTLDITDFTNAQMHEAQGKKSAIAR